MTALCSRIVLGESRLDLPTVRKTRTCVSVLASTITPYIEPTGYPLKQQLLGLPAVACRGSFGRTVLPVGEPLHPELGDTTARPRAPWACEDEFRALGSRGSANYPGMLPRGSNIRLHVYMCMCIYIEDLPLSILCIYIHMHREIDR